ncbi:BamA/TamA family outer membrane protein [Pedobacter sp. MC2016-15]|uniref:BamA/TamA family outer membrane protein n=1 Tax=Pedobacter sp. MC2016-15 TaxID=2994473 RepID=UPI002247CB60|nr:BamA/TamA family outer membrane protein [Pedobacter sp. MC2016-15]MCX2479783.1 BamA/TamA family outer membrane protein [Pedobacter sp. MC2016-15]
MPKRLPLLLLLTSFAGSVQAQNSDRAKSSARQNFPDSVVVKVHPSYADVGGVHKWFFGTNFRKEWAAPVSLPLIKISKVYGGLSPVKEGGGMQSKSLRLADAKGKEYVIRSVEKTPDKLLPEGLRGTFALDWVDDAMSGQHPFSALIVPPLAAAANVEHANPVIGVVAPDEALGEFNKQFSGMVVLLEEREPGGESDNTPKMIKELNEDNDHHFDGKQFLRARLLDLLIGDWDRHEDQWRWLDTKDGKGKRYVAVPRDRDQVFHVNQGLFPSIAALPWINPLFGDFGPELSGVKYSLFKTRFMKGFPDAQLSHAEYMQVVNEFVKAETDEVLESGLKRLPKEVYLMRHDELYTALRQRRDNMPAAMDEYYRFINRIVDIKTSDKNEKVTITDAPNRGTRVVIQKIDKEGQLKDQIMDITYQPDITKEIRLYVSGGNDQVLINTNEQDIKLRVVGGQGNKLYDVQQAGRKIRVYDKKDSIRFTGNTGRLHTHLSNDTLNTKFIPTNLYNVWIPLATAALNRDDGFLLGLGMRFVKKDGFRKLPYSSSQQIMVTHSFATDAFRVRYNGEWIQALGNADITLQAVAQAPDNTMNFFGRGNESPLVKMDNYRRYYRTRFDTYQVDPALRWHVGNGNTLSAGPSLQFYHLNFDDNDGRFINQQSQIKSYDSATVNRDKAHLGFLVNFNSNHRNNNILPSEGYYLNVTMQGYTGLNHYSKSYLQIRPEFTFYQKLNSKGTIVISDRIGGGVTVGQAAFYQSMFLGGQGNLLGYLQYRFAGEQMVYNNLQARVKLFNVASYILPGQLGLSGFYDAGRVWEKGEDSDKWHQGKGGGLYFSPAGLTIVQLMAGHSPEGWYPFFSMNFRI